MCCCDGLHWIYTKKMMMEREEEREREKVWIIE
jgi:hypothetical protein